MSLSQNGSESRCACTHSILNKFPLTCNKSELSDGLFKLYTYIHIYTHTHIHIHIKKKCGNE